MINFLKGKKTYIVGTLMFLLALLDYLTGTSTLQQFLNSAGVILGLNGLGLMTLRAAIGKLE